MYNHKGWYFPNLDTHFQTYVEEWPATSYQQLAFDSALKYVRKYDVAIDIGANVGLHTVRFSQKFNHVYSFEPTSVNYECLVLNTQNLKNVSLIKVGLGEITKDEKISIPKDAQNCGIFSIVDFVDKENLISEQIEIRKLDSFNLNPNLIKIDTQGFELLVLKGATNTLRSKPVLIIECEKKSDKKMITDFLLKQNYHFKESIRKDTIWAAD